MRFLASLAFLASILATTPAVAQIDDAQAAKAKFAAGARHFDLSEFDEALADFKDAYRNKPDPVLLYNIAQCHRKLGHTDEAISFYQSYLRRAPEAKNRDEVERRIKELEVLRDAQGAANAPAASAPAALPASEVVQGAAEQPSTTPVAALDFSKPAEREPVATGPVTTRWWFWTALGAVAAGTVTAIVIVAAHDPTKVPASGLGSQKALP